MFQVESSRYLARDLVVRLPVVVDLSSPKRNKTVTTAQFCPFFCWNKFAKSDLALFWHNGCCAVLPMFVFISYSVSSEKVVRHYRTGLAVRFVPQIPPMTQVASAMQFDFDERIFAATACPQVFFFLQSKNAKSFFEERPAQNPYKFWLTVLSLYAKFPSNSNQKVMWHFCLGISFQSSLWIRTRAGFFLVGPFYDRCLHFCRLLGLDETRPTIGGV